jgi:hypothetical protein
MWSENKTMRYIRTIALLLVCLACSNAPESGISVEKKSTMNGNSYTIIWQGSCKMEFTDQRPDAKDKTIQACIAGAFTQLENYKVDGVYMCNGSIRNNTGVNTHLGGAIKIIGGQAAIFPTQKGALLTSDFLSKLSVQKGSLFQQIQLIENGTAASFKDKAVFQRRAIVIFKDGKTAFVEGNEAVTLAEFSADLVELGADNALYTDMGGWDEGWYIHPNTKKKVIIGQIRSHTPKQSNWVIFRK